MVDTTAVPMDTTYGPVTGVTENDISRFLGIPYAAAPVGDHRFGEPVPPDQWTATKLCDSFGPTPPRAEGGPFGELLSGKEPVPGDNWLNLNVWTPAPDTTARLPVMVWIHGGAFLLGSSAGTAYDGSTFARDGVVCVSPNYRLGVEGFGYIEDALVKANRGLLDQICALQWVRDNIARFGGDRDNVTVFGESTGAMSILTLLSLDLGLFHKAIAQSGSAHVVQTPADAALVLGLIAEKLGVEPTRAGFSALAPSDVIGVQSEIQQEITQAPDPEKHGASTVATGGMSLVPVVDGELLTRRPIDAIALGAGADIPLLIGTNVEEERYFVLPPMLNADPTREQWRSGSPSTADRAATSCSTATRPGRRRPTSGGPHARSSQRR